MPENGDTNSGDGCDSNHNKHKALYHFVWVVGAFVVFLIVDFVFLWSEHHFVSLLVLWAGSSLIAVWEMGVREIWPGWIILSVCALFVIAILAYLIIGPVRIPETEVTGLLQPGSEKTPPNRCDRAPFLIDDKALKILIGDNAFAETGMRKFVALRVGQCDVVEMERTDKGIGVYAHLYDENGNLKATITNNQIDVLTGEKIKMTRTGDLRTLTVTDEKGNELLYCRYLNPTTISVRGTFSCPGYSPVTVRDQKPIGGDSGTFENNCGVDSGGPGIWIDRRN